MGALLSVAALAAVAGCRTDGQPDKRAAETTTAPSASFASPPSSAAVAAVAPRSAAAVTATSAATASNASPPATRCKAIEKAKPVVGLFGGSGTGLGVATRGGRVLALVHLGGRVVPISVARDGADRRQLPGFASPLEADVFRVDDDAVYFVASRRLVRTAFDGSAPSVLLTDASPSFALHGDFVYAVDCNSRLVRLDRRGGASTVVADLKTTNDPHCRRKRLAVDGATASLGDREVDLLTGTSREAHETWVYPGDVTSTKARLWYHRDGQLLPSPPTDDARMPMSWLEANAEGAWTESHWFHLAHGDYRRTEAILRVDRMTAEVKVLDSWRLADPIFGGGRVGIAVDDQCLYVMTNLPNDKAFEIAARPLPP